MDENLTPDQLFAEDPHDRLIRQAHGFTYDDDPTSDTLLCRNGCGLTYNYVSACKIEVCPMIDCPGAIFKPRSTIGGQMMTACSICGEVNSSTVIVNHRKVNVRKLAERLRAADDYTLVLAERDYWKGLVKNDGHDS